MEKTEYCPFVSSQYFICECGENYPSEEILRVHLEKGHAKLERFQSRTLCYDKNTYYIVANDDIKTETIDTEINEYVQTEEPTEEFYIVPGIETCKTEEESETICEDVEITPKEEIPDVSEEQNGTDMLSCRQVVFKTAMLQDQPVILDQENEEHCYNKNVPKFVNCEFFYCSVCGKTFSTERLMKMHLASTHDLTDGTQRKTKKKILPKNVICEVCGKKYASQAALRYHMRVHTGEKPYKCTLCTKSFTMPLFLLIHTRTHTGEKPYKCEECPKAFSNKAAILRHTRVHTGEKPYTCPECQKAFSQSNSMKLHIQTVHLKLPAPYKSRARKLKAIAGNKRVVKLEIEEAQEYEEQLVYENDDVDDYVYHEVFIRQ